LEAFKGMLACVSPVLPDCRFDIEDLVAEGDAVVARYTGEMRDGGGKTISLRVRPSTASPAARSWKTIR
jgi:predicted ester cyclase